MEEKIVTCRIGGKEYPMCLTMRATKAITDKFGGVAEVGEMLAELQGNLAQALELVVWLIRLLIRDACDQRRLLHPEEEALLPPSEEEMELLLKPGDLVAMRNQILLCMAVGMGREVESESGKNPEAGQTNEDSLPG